MPSSLRVLSICTSCQEVWRRPLCLSQLRHLEADLLGGCKAAEGSGQRLRHSRSVLPSAAVIHQGDHPAGLQ